ncbi:MAG: tRNA 2-thiouridine(34) synthase MnmA [Spirochaetaceae bacterium]|nr:MAG: tRNA 2-thiouridine(34) synthase MnmA [Spirochaetaceae bacterium]
MPMVLAIALSGGVDSAVAAVLLSRKYPRMVGASHVIWPDSRCCSVEVLNRARDTCKLLDIPYIQEDLCGEFRDQVVEDFIQTYLSGKTPNPCVICNKTIRFDAFYSRLKQTLRERELLGEAEDLLFSTGHYASIVETSDGVFIGKGVDPIKDQSYMLYQVRREMLANMVLPLGAYRKSEILNMAEELGLPYTQVKESQDACFVEGDYVAFISKQTGRSDFLRSGDIVDPQGRVLGKHSGTINYTVGQRRGLGLGNGPWYVACIEPQENRLVVAREADARRRDFQIDRANWFVDPPARPLSCTVKIRYQIGEIPCSVEPLEEGFLIVLKHPQIVTPGQSAVFYDRELVLGGGMIL